VREVHVADKEEERRRNGERKSDHKVSPTRGPFDLGW
jgi:hypothetical protein